MAHVHVGAGLHLQWASTMSQHDSMASQESLKPFGPHKAILSAVTKLEFGVIDMSAELMFYDVLEMK